MWYFICGMYVNIQHHNIYTGHIFYYRIFFKGVMDRSGALSTLYANLCFLSSIKVFCDNINILLLFFNMKGFFIVAE